MNKIQTGPAIGSSTTASLITPVNSNASQAGQASAPVVREVQSTPTGQGMIDAYRSSSSGAYVPPGTEQIAAALTDASPSALHAILSAAASACDFNTLTKIAIALHQLPGDKEAARAVLGKAVNATDGNGDTVLMVALKTVRDEDKTSTNRLVLPKITQFVSNYLALGADCRISNGNGETAALLAMKSGCSADTTSYMVSRLLDDTEIDHADAQGDTVLMHAVTLQSEALVKELLKRGASASLQTRPGKESAAQLAWNDPDYRSDSIKEMLRREAPQQQVAAVNTRSRALSSSSVQQAFEAIGAGNRKALERLLNEQPSILEARNEDDHTPLMVAAIHGRVDMARLLLEKGAQANAVTRTGETALLHAIRHEHAQLVFLLIDKSANIADAKSKGRCMAAHAAEKGLASVVVKLLERMSSALLETDRVDLLESAFRSGSRETVQVVTSFLTNSAEGRALLDYQFCRCVAASLYTPVSEVPSRAEGLLEAGADVDGLIPQRMHTGSAGGTTALMLLAHGPIDGNYTDAIHIAHLLIARGADPQRKNAKGQTALDIARAKGCQPMIDLLSGGAPSSTASSSSASSTSSSSFGT